jgi:hypothetical protein
MTSEDLIQPWIGCDKCHSAKAAYLVRLINGELYFCSHHLNKYKGALDSLAYEIVELDRKEEAAPQREKEEINGR